MRYTIEQNDGKGTFSENVNIYYNQENNEIKVSCDEGRAQRPLIVIKDGKPLLTEKHLEQMNNGEITWLDLVRQ